ncbi:LAME_0G07778g1_1 [Lachancea meyersii CBS 8951]|uniref:LAME_0G07778g1_1 n=1 Tax=Lachancea meyersii CBS 8951 TaxID=1266667 RepID=A0A1G4K807_9SACH|nr:LAME_0G07778g1_1 [Lachancea meyersii CBS 8951]
MVEHVEHNVVFGVFLVNFHHSKGPEVEYSYGLPEGMEASKIWPYLPFQALPDGSHSFEETFTYFTLVYNETERCGSPVEGAAAIPADEVDNYTTFFAISCSRQIRSKELLQKGCEVTRSTVQKAIVVVARRPIFGQIKDKLSIVTNAYFMQRDFTNKSILDTLYGNLSAMYKLSGATDESHMYVGLCLRRVIHDFGKEVLTILKAILLERKVLFYGSDVEALCNVQFGFIGLIPNLISHLQDCGSPMLHSYFDNLKVVDSFKSSDRQSVLKFLGFPLQVFGDGGLFSPYSPLQQLEDLDSKKTTHFVAGTSNSLLLEQKDQVCEVLVNVNTFTVEVVTAARDLHGALQLTSHDKRWMDSIVSIVAETWNENDFTTPKNLQFEGSEDFLRWQFEDYLTGLISCEKLHSYLENNRNNEMAMKSISDEWASSSPIDFYGSVWVEKWRETQNYKAFNLSTDDRIFDLFPPKHVFNTADTSASLQQKLSKSFQAFRRKESTLQRDKPQSTDNKVGTPENADSSKPIPITETSRENEWTSWKDYFGKKKKVKGHENPSTPIPSTHTISSGSTHAAIGNALLSLGFPRTITQEDFEEVDTPSGHSNDQSDAEEQSKSSPSPSERRGEHSIEDVEPGADIEKSNVWAE